MTDEGIKYFAGVVEKTSEKDFTKKDGSQRKLFGIKLVDGGWFNGFGSCQCKAGDTVKIGAVMRLYNGEEKWDAKTVEVAPLKEEKIKVPFEATVEKAEKERFCWRSMNMPLTPRICYKDTCMAYGEGKCKLLDRRV